MQESPLSTFDSLETETGTCPVSGSRNAKLLLERKNFPLYQHPVPDNKNIEDIRFDLRYLYCPESGHAYQQEFRQDMLEKLYQYHYYTPAASHIAYTLKERFEKFFNRVLKEKDLSILEIASSSGEVIERLKNSNPTFSFTGFEPSERTADDAIAKGIETIKEFFGTEMAQKHDRQYDAIFARHLIEHIFDFEDFFTGINTATHDDSVLIFETPALDHYLEKASINPFHVEHIHLFSCHSLSMLGKKYGWYTFQYEITENGNMLMAFKKDKNLAMEIPTPSLENVPLLRNRSEKLKADIAKETEGLDVYVWGAGSYGRFIHGLLDKDPVMFLDGNPAKEGQLYIGTDIPIRHSTTTVKELHETGKDNNAIILIASTYFREIQSELKNLDWTGKVLTVSELI